GTGRAIGVGMDVTSESSVRAALDEAVLAYGGLDIVVSNAGIAHSAPIDQLDLADWERSFAVNATGHFLVAREGVRLLKAQGRGARGSRWTTSRSSTGSAISSGVPSFPRMWPRPSCFSRPTARPRPPAARSRWTVVSRTPSPARAMIRAHLRRWRPRPHAQRT